MKREWTYTDFGTPNSPLYIHNDFVFNLGRDPNLKKLYELVASGKKIFNHTGLMKELTTYNENIKEHFIYHRLRYGSWGVSRPKAFFDPGSGNKSSNIGQYNELRTLEGDTPFPQANEEHFHNRETVKSVTSELIPQNNYKSIVFNLAYGNSKAWYVRVMEAQRETIIHAKHYKYMLIYIDYEYQDDENSYESAKYPGKFVRKRWVVIPNRRPLQAEFESWGHEKLSYQIRQIIKKNVI